MNSLKYYSKFGIPSLLVGMMFICNPVESRAEGTKFLTNSTNNSGNKSFVTEAVSKSGPAVVTIETQRKVVVNNNIFPPNFFLDPTFEKFFGQPKLKSPRTSVQLVHGSGVIFSSKGLVLTNAHVVENTDELIVGLSNGKRFKGRVIGEDPLTDLAVIQVNGQGPWPSALIGDSDQIVVGDWAIAVGNPFGLEKTVTLGIISNLNRNVSQLGISDKRLKLIQTDAAINPGNSGGPLLNANGEVIGINTLVRTGPGAGLGFAIPINQAIKIANQLVKQGKAIHPMIGVNLAYLINKETSIDLVDNGARIVVIFPNSPAENEGLKVNDIILEVNGVKIKSPDDVVDLINENGIKNKINFKIKRNNSVKRFSIQPVDINTFKMS